MRKFLIQFACWLPVVCIPSYFFVDSMQSMGRFDSLGWWYTVYCTLGFAVPVAVAIGFFDHWVDAGRLRRWCFSSSA